MDKLSKLSVSLVTDVKLSNAKTVEQLILNETQCNSSGDLKEKYNGKNQSKP